jgi:hypothetical protein
MSGTLNLGTTNPCFFVGPHDAECMTLTITCKLGRDPNERWINCEIMFIGPTAISTLPFKQLYQKRFVINKLSRAGYVT